jgi:hypothetical protein
MASPLDLDSEDIAHNGPTGALSPFGGAAPRLASASEREAHGREISEQLASVLELTLRALRTLDVEKNADVEAEAQRALVHLTLRTNEAELDAEAKQRLAGHKQALADALRSVIRRTVQAIDAI